jgi:hypothetical protein
VTEPGSDRDELAACVRQAWPAVLQRLGERQAAFEAAVAARAAGHGLGDALQAARYLNLCLAFGPGFEDKTENEWALAVLADERLAPAVKLHQLVHRAGRELQRRPEDARALQLTDHALLDLADAQRRRHGADVAPMPRVACDIDAVELRLLDAGWRQEYQRGDGGWPRAAAAAPAPLRIGAGHPAPAVVHVITGARGDAEHVRLQLRQVPHGRCGLGLHPAVRWLNAAGATDWHDPAARSVAWPLQAFVPERDAGPRLLGEVPPEVTLIELPSCGLRDEGVPLGAVRLQLWAYAAWQSLLVMERQADLGFDLPPTGASPPAASPTRLRHERDGVALPVADWQQGFDQGLRDALGQGLQNLLQAWSAHVQDAALRADFALFDGRAGFTWGWREGARGLASPPVQRIVAAVDWSARGDLHLQGLVEYAGARAHLHLRVDGQARLQAQVERLVAETPTLAIMQQTELRWRWPVQLAFDPVADASAAVFSELGPGTGALVGSLGLRPSVTRGGRWEWFASLALEPVATRVVVHDPVLGRSESRMALLGSQTLLDWSLA